VWELAQRMLDISAEGLKRRAALDSVGMTEEGFLVPLRELVNRGYTRAEELLHAYRTDWGRDLKRIFTEYNFL
jgi:glutamate--cysteine ligase